MQTYNAISTKVRPLIYLLRCSYSSFLQGIISYLRFSFLFFTFFFFQGLARFPQDLYDVEPADYASGPAQALLIRSHKLQESEVDVACRAIARCGAGTNKYVPEDLRLVSRCFFLIIILTHQQHRFKIIQRARGTYDRARSSRFQHTWC